MFFGPYSINEYFIISLHKLKNNTFDHHIIILLQIPNKSQFEIQKYIPLQSSTLSSSALSLFCIIEFVLLVPENVAPNKPSQREQPLWRANKGRILQETQCYTP